MNNNTNITENSPIQSISNKRKCKIKKQNRTNVDNLEKEYPKISKINNNIYLGSYEHPYNNTNEFQELKIDIIFNCAKEINYTLDDKYIIEHFLLENDEYASILEYIDEANDKLHKYLTEGKRIYLHCDNGSSRSPAILIYYLMMRKKFDYFRALSLLQRIRQSIEINDNFERELRIIDED